MSFKHKKKYGQNFLTDEKEILEKIISVSNVNENDEVIEIGPGEGALTELLIDNAKRVYSFEIDEDLEKILKKKFGNKENYTLVMGDVLDADFNVHIKNSAKIVANIPYYITSPIVDKILKNRKIITEAYIMVQKEVGERICAKKGKERSVLTLAVEYFADAKYLFTIPREKFTPIPNVDSAFIAIKPYSEPKYENLVSEEVFFKYVKAAFSSKRKNITNNLSTLNFSKEIIKEKLKSLGISENERAENISIEDFIKIIKSFEGESYE